MARTLRAIRQEMRSQISRALLAAASCLAVSTGAVPSLAQPATAAPSDDLYFVNEAGERVAFTPAYESWFGRDRYRPNYLRAAAENAIVVALELFIYWHDPRSNSQDWQFPDVVSKLESKDAVRFDDNLMRTNYLYHSFAGASHYLFTRVNGFGVPESFATAAAFSTLYEFVLEWRELVSLNDLIVTPLGGAAAGELLHQLGNYLNSEPPHVHTRVRQPAENVLRDGAQVTIGFPRRLHDNFDDPPYPVRLERDSLGLSSAWGHEFRVWTGLTMAGNDEGQTRALIALGGKIELAAMPGFLRPGVIERWYGAGNFTRAEVRSAFAGSWYDVELDIDSHLFGLYSQDIEVDEDGLSGQANELGFGTGLHYLDRRLFGRRDQLGVVHVFRPVERAWFFLGPARLELELDVSPDFASLHSAAYEEYVRRFGMEGTKASLARYGYLHSWGLSAGASAALRLGDAELAARGRFGRYESIDGVDREQDNVTVDSHGIETVLDFGASLTLAPVGAPVFGRFDYSETLRRSILEPDIEVNRSDRRALLAFGLVF